MKILIGLKQSGSLISDPFLTPINLILGQYAKIGSIVTDDFGKAITITGYTLKLRIKKSNGSVLVITHAPIDNNKGESEFILIPADISSLNISQKQDVEIEYFLTATPAVNSFFTIKGILNVVDQTVV